MIELYTLRLLPEGSHRDFEAKLVSTSSEASNFVRSGLQKQKSPTT